MANREVLSSRIQCSDELNTYPNSKNMVENEENLAFVQLISRAVFRVQQVLDCRDD